MILHQPMNIQFGNLIPSELYVEYPIAERVMECFWDRMDFPNPHRPLGCLLVGDPDNGKSRILKQWIHDYSNAVTPLGVGDLVPIVYVDAPSRCSQKHLYQEFGRKLRVPIAERMNLDRSDSVLMDHLEKAGTKVIVIDELQHLYTGGSLKFRAVLDRLKTFSNTLGITIFAAGTELAYDLIRDDEQYLSRMPPMRLPGWDLNENYLGLLLAFEEEMNVPQGSFTSKDASSLIWKHSGRSIGRTVRVLNDTLKEANRRNGQEITLDDINRAGFSDLPWVVGED